MIELTTSAMLLLSMFYGTPIADAKATEAKIPTTVFAQEDRNIVEGKALIAQGGNVKSVEIDVREYFEDTPILAEIAKCESRFKHVGEKGDIIRGKVNSDDIGVMQINTFYHEDEATRLGINLKTLQGNMEYAKKLYEKEGTDPWISSSKCWKKYVSISKN